MKTVFKLLIINILLIFISCQQNIESTSIQKKQGTTTSVVPATLASNNNKNEVITLATFFNEKEIAALRTIKEQFDQGISNKKVDHPLSYYYKSHAQRIRLDLFNKYPIHLNFPYNGKFDISQVEAEVQQLSFLTKKCGFQKKDDTIQYFYCFKQSSNFMDFQKAIGQENSLIKFFVEDYQSNKSITPKVKESLFMNSQEDFNFDKEEHQIIYLLYHLLVNEERIALEKVNKA